MNKFKKVIAAVLSGCLMIGATAGVTAGAADGRIVVEKGVGYWVYDSFKNGSVQLPTVIKNGGYYGINYRTKDRNGEYHVCGIQRMLNHRGSGCGTVDGIIGPKTDEAIKKFQGSIYIKKDGIVGKDTYSRLVKIYDAYDRVLYYKVRTNNKATTLKMGK